MRKQNQKNHISLNRCFEQNNSCYDFHNAHNSICPCKLCLNQQYPENPEIRLDDMYEKLKTQKFKQLAKKNELLRSQIYNLQTSGKLQQSKFILGSNSFKKQKNKQIQSYLWYLNKLATISKTLPNFPILDIMVLQKGILSFYISQQFNKAKIYFNTSFCSQTNRQHNNYSIGSFNIQFIKNTLIQKKFQFDLQYQKKRYRQLNPKFQFAQLQHESQKQINNFQKKIKFIDKNLNRVAIIKQKQIISNSSNKYSINQMHDSNKKSFFSNNSNYQTSLPYLQNQQKILTKYQFQNLFDKTRTKVCQLQQICYVQLFPIMNNEQQHSYIKQIKYFRQTQIKKQLYKQAQNYVLTWLQKNQTLEKIEQSFIQRYFYKKQNQRKVQQYQKSNLKRLIYQIEQQYLLYQTFKLMLHFQAETNNVIEQALIQFITNDLGATFFLKNIKYIKYSTKHQVELKQNKMPSYKFIDKEDYILDLGGQMKQLFSKFQLQFQLLDRDSKLFQAKWQNDKKLSNQIFKQVTGTTNQNISFHNILKSNDKQYKEKMLKINDKNIIKK